MLNTTPGGEMEHGRSRSPLDAKHLQMLFDNIDGIVFQTESDDTNVRVVYASKTDISCLPCSPGEPDAPSRCLCGIVLPEDCEHLWNAILTAGRTGTVLDETYRSLNPQGDAEWLHVRGTRLPEQGDGIHRMIHIANDITRQKRAETALWEKTQVIEFAMKNTDINLWFLDFRTRDCILSENCKRVHEMPDVEVLHNFPDSLFARGYVRPDCVEPMRKAYETLFETGKDFQLDVWYPKSDGSGWWCERAMVTTVAGTDGKPTHAIGMGKNMTAMKELEEKYQAFQAYRKLADKNIVASFRMNLTQNWCGDCVSDSSAVLEQYTTSTVDGFFDIARTRISSKEDLARCEEVFSRELLLAAFSRGERSKRMEYRYCTESGRTMWLRTAVEMISNPVTEDVEALLYSFDIDYEKNMQFIVERLLSDDYEFLGLMDASTGYFLVFGADSKADGSALGRSYYDDAIPGVLHRFLAEEYWEEGIRTMGRAHILAELERAESYNCSFPTHGLGKMREGRCQWKFTYLDASHSQILITCSDITDVYTAERDDLTGLYNRQTFYRHARDILAKNPTQKFVMLRCDIDRFKAYNEAYGMQEGNKLLAEFGRAVRRLDWPQLTLFGRIEADHFCALFPSAQFDLEGWDKLYSAWLGRISQSYRLSSSIGIYEITDPSIDVSLMCDRALLALLTVKQNYVNKIAWYDDSLRKKLMAEQALADDMETALREEQFVLYFQPQINYNDGTIVGAEALVRWKHPVHGLIMPGDFIPIFEKNGFILRLDAYVWEKSCQYLRKWLDEDGQREPVPLSVNISRCDIYDTSLCSRLRALIEKYRLPPALLKLEITESAYMENPEQLLDVVRELQSIGFTVEMDDFGAGYSSLNTLKDVPVDVLKLDIRFLSSGQDDARGGLILSSVIRMARWLKLSVVAEGVETMVQADYLKSLSCFYMQGYHFARPMPADEFEAFLRRGIPGKMDHYTEADFGGADALWDPAAQSSLLFNRFVGGAAFLEYDGTAVEILRANDNFYLELGTTREDYLEAQRHTLRRFEGEHRAAFLAMLADVARTGGEAECTLQSLPHKEGGQPFWTHLRAHLLTQNRDRFLVYLSVERVDPR